MKPLGIAAAVGVAAAGAAYFCMAEFLDGSWLHASELEVPVAGALGLLAGLVAFGLLGARASAGTGGRR